MIGIFVKIPFHAQQKRADPALAAELSRAAAEAARVFGARILPSEESFFLAFDEGTGCPRLRAAEAARSLGARLARLAPRLHGYALILGEGPLGSEELERELRRSWYLVRKDGLFIEEGSAGGFRGYVETDEGEGVLGVLAFPYTRPLYPETYAPPSPDAGALDRFVDEAGRHGIGESEADLLLAVGPGASPGAHVEAALGLLYGQKAASFLRLRASVGESAPYGPFLEAVATKPDQAGLALLSAPERQALEELAPVGDFLASSPYRQGYTPTIRTRTRLYAAARLRLYARLQRAAGLPALVVLEGLDRFPPESLDLVSELFGEGLAEEGVVVLGTAERPPLGLPRARLRILAAPPPSPAAIAAAATAGAEGLGERSLAPRLAALAEGDPFRLGLALTAAGRTARRSPSGEESAPRLPGGRLGTEALVALALAAFPSEYAEYLLALGLAEEVLDQPRLGEFLRKSGFLPGVEPLLRETLAGLGLVGAAGRPRLSRAEALAGAEAVSGEGAARIKAGFAELLLSLHLEGRILPGAALFRRVAASGAPLDSGGRQGARRVERSRFFLDCVAADDLYGPSERPGTQALDIPLAGLGAFLEAYALADGEEAERRLADLDAKALGPGSEPLAAAIAALARASDEYARGSAQAAAARAKAALIALHDLGAARSEARAHRLLGLAALAQAQVQEGAYYLANAFELAAAQKDPFECFHAAFAEAGAQLVLGDLRRAEQRGRAAAEWAAKAFRADWEAAADFLSGRVAFELGRYEAAAESFGRVRAAARVYGEPEAAFRAEVWAGRAAAYSGEYGRARELLARRKDDAEAAWFLGECAYFEGDEAEAARSGREALDLIPERPYASADALLWGSGFDSFEARSLGAGRGRSYLEDQVLAFSRFAEGLARRDPSLVAAIAALTREERLAALHPAAHLYHFYCCRILEATGAASPDPGTVLSKAFKALQTRSVRIEEASLKTEFLEKNRWNAALMAAARAKKLL